MTFPPMESLVPQRDAMMLLDRVVAADEASATCELAVREGATFMREGLVPAAAFLEYMAQAAAAFVGLRARAGAPREGYLLAAREMELFTDGARAGDVLRVRATWLDGDASLARFRAEVTREGATLATATLTVHLGATP